MFCKAIKDCTTKEKCDVAISKKFPTGMPTRPECPEGQVCMKTVYQLRLSAFKVYMQISEILHICDIY